MRVPLYVDGAAVALINYPDTSVGHPTGHRFKIGTKTDLVLDLVMIWIPDEHGKRIKCYAAFARAPEGAEVVRCALFEGHKGAIKPQHVPAFTEAFKVALGC